VHLLTETVIDKTERETYRPVWDDHEWAIHAHGLLLKELLKLVEVDCNPLEMLKLLIGDYASLDAWGSYTLTDVLNEHLEKIPFGDDQTYRDYFEGTSLPFTRVLWNMERRGIKVDMDAIDTLRQPMKTEIDEIKREMTKEAGQIVNLNSSLQMRALFYEEVAGEWQDPFGEAPKYWSKGGADGIKKPSTNKDALKDWADKGHKLATLMQQFRQLDKLHGTYLVGVPRWADGYDRIHTSLKQTGTVTHRLASGDPNLQNIPSRPPWGPLLRAVFIAGLWGDCNPDWCMPEVENIPVPDLPPETQMRFLVADYSQVELRITAHLSQDETMIQAIHDGKDLHCLTAAIAGGHDYDELYAAKKATNPSKRQLELLEERRRFKAVGFGIIYGIGAVKLGRDLGLPILKRTSRSGHVYEVCPEGEQLIEDYFNVYPGVKEFLDETTEFCEENLYVTTAIGRYRRLPMAISGERGLQARTRRQAGNSRVQGTAADITNEAMILCETDPVLRELGVRMLLQIHDELLFECPDIPEIVTAAKKRVLELMDNSIELSVPITAEIDDGYTWAAAK